MSASSTKSMTIGESGLSLTFAVTAFLCVFAAAKALDTAFAFHASLAAAASAASTASRSGDGPPNKAPISIVAIMPPILACPPALAEAGQTG